VSLHPSLLKAEAFRLRREDIIKSAMPRRLPDEVLRQDLEEMLEALEDETLHPMRREIIMGQLASVRRLLGITPPDTFTKGVH